MIKCKERKLNFFKKLVRIENICVPYFGPSRNQVMNAD